MSALATDTQLWWYTARSSGIVAWAMLTTSVLWGLLLSTKVLGKRPRPSWLLDLHRFLGGAAVVFTGVHLAALSLDSYVGFGLTELLVPFTGTYRPSAVALGIAGLYLLVAIEVTSLLRSRLSKQVWRSVHHLSFPLFVLATAHAIAAGTDGHALLLRFGLITGALFVALLTAVRTAQADDHDGLTSPRVQTTR